MRIIIAIVVSFGIACTSTPSGESSKIGKPGDPGYITPKPSFSVFARLGDLSIDKEGAGVQVSHYEQPDSSEALSIECLVADGRGTVQLFFWARDTLPQEIDIATYQAVSATGEHEKVRLAYEVPQGDVRVASSGTIRVEQSEAGVTFKVTGLRFDGDGASQPLEIASGTLGGEIAERCYVIDADNAGAMKEDGEGPIVTPTPGAALPAFTEDPNGTSSFCAERLK